MYFQLFLKKKKSIKRYYFFKILRALRIASTDTPTSENTADHIVAIPKADNSKTDIF